MLDVAVFRQVMRTFPTGVTVVAARDGEGVPLGLTVNSFTSVSLDPPTVLICIDRGSTSHDRLVDAGAFTVNILASGQDALASRFATDPAADRFDGVVWSAGPNGAPVLDGVAAWLACTVEAVHPGGDHSILVARVDDARAASPSSMVFFGGAFGEMGP